ncbi:CAP domain-containing protein [Silicimonas sp. MF1-12-2]|uniref:CAP domain-containing protein n=1 Tax=Silicimonas sp. MF1-12-2 TaxID=3384793 RepID=UPI0039B63FDC
MIAALFALLFGGIAAMAAGGGSSPAPVPAGPTGFAPPPPPDEDDADQPGSAAPEDPTPSPLPPQDNPDLPASAYALDWAGLSPEEQLIVELINRARLDPADELTRQTDGFASGVTTAPKEALAVVSTLSHASREHSQDMDDRNFFAHTNPDGQSPADRAVEEGHGSRYVGENIGWIGSSSTGFDRQDRVEDHHGNLWDSDGHQQNFMSDNWSEIGIGYDYGTHSGLAGSTFVTEMFGDRGDTYLTGVVIEDRDGDDFYDLGEGQGAVRITAEAADGTLYTTSTWDAGGYTLKLPPGTYRVTFEGGDLDAPYSTTVTIGSENVKLDVFDPGASGGVAVSAALLPDTEPEDSPGTEVLTLLSLPPDDEATATEALDEPEPEMAFF